MTRVRCSFLQWDVPSTTTRDRDDFVSVLMYTYRTDLSKLGDSSGVNVNPTTETTPCAKQKKCVALWVYGGGVAIMYQGMGVARSSTVRSTSSTTRRKFC